MSQLLNIYVDPGKAFAELKERPTFLLPALLVLVATVASIALYYFTVDAEWLAGHMRMQMLAAQPDANPRDLEPVIQMMSKPMLAMAMTLGGMVFGFFTKYVLLALYFLLAAKIGGATLSFRHALALVSWAAMPLLLGAVVLAVGVLTSPAQVGLEQLNLLNIDPLLVQVPYESSWSAFAKSFSLLSVWVWFLTALGWRIWTGSGWGAALFVALIPPALFWGGWALIAAVF